MLTSQIESYFLENEKKVNRLISKVLPLFCFVGPIILICEKIGIFDISVKYLVFFSLSVFIITISVFKTIF